MLHIILTRDTLSQEKRNKFLSDFLDEEIDNDDEDSSLENELSEEDISHTKEAIQLAQNFQTEFDFKLKEPNYSQLALYNSLSKDEAEIKFKDFSGSKSFAENGVTGTINISINKDVVLMTITSPVKDNNFSSFKAISAVAERYFLYFKSYAYTNVDIASHWNLFSSLKDTPLSFNEITDWYLKDQKQRFEHVYHPAFSFLDKIWCAGFILANIAAFGLLVFIGHHAVQHGTLIVNVDPTAIYHLNVTRTENTAQRVIAPHYVAHGNIQENGEEVMLDIFLKEVYLAAQGQPLELYKLSNGNRPYVLKETFENTRPHLKIGNIGISWIWILVLGFSSLWLYLLKQHFHKKPLLRKTDHFATTMFVFVFFPLAIFLGFLTAYFKR